MRALQKPSATFRSLRGKSPQPSEGMRLGQEGTDSVTPGPLGKADMNAAPLPWQKRAAVRRRR